MAATRSADDLRAGFTALGSRLSAIRLRRSREDRVVAGVCSGIARTLDVDVTVVRLLFALLALAGGGGIILYFAAWRLVPEEGSDRPIQKWGLAGAVLLFIAIVLVVQGLGLDQSLLWPAAFLVLGIALVSQTAIPLLGAPRRRRTALGIVLVVIGVALFVSYGNIFSGGSLVPPGAIVAVLLLVLAPWLWRLAREREAERAERIRTQERAEMAARVHDSVLQTLALIQRESDPRRVATLARRQERELRTWLYREGGPLEDEALVASIEAAATEIEEMHGVPVEVVSSGDAPLDDDLRALVLAAREAMANAAKFSGADEVSVYAEVGDAGATVFVRDRGVGFDRDAVPPDRRGLAESIEGRLRRHGGTALITSALGEGTEVELSLPGSKA